MQILAEGKPVDRLLGGGAGFEVVVLRDIAQLPVTGEVPQEKELQKVKSGGTILFVEDESSIREMTTMYLEAEGYRVIEANDGAQAVMLLKKREQEIDLVLTDLKMPGGLNGQQLVERLQADRPNLKAIFVSGYSSELFGEETFLDETTNFLQKPYQLKNLSEMVQGCLDREKAA